MEIIFNWWHKRSTHGSKLFLVEDKKCELSITLKCVRVNHVGILKRNQPIKSKVWTIRKPYKLLRLTIARMTTGFGLRVS